MRSSILYTERRVVKRSIARGALTEQASSSRHRHRGVVEDGSLPSRLLSGGTFRAPMPPPPRLGGAAPAAADVRQLPTGRRSQRVGRRCACSPDSRGRPGLVCLGAGLRDLLAASQQNAARSPEHATAPLPVCSPRRASSWLQPAVGPRCGSDATATTRGGPGRLRRAAIDRFPRCGAAGAAPDGRSTLKPMTGSRETVCAPMRTPGHPRHTLRHDWDPP